MNTWERIRKNLINKKNKTVFAIRNDENIQKPYLAARSLCIDGPWQSILEGLCSHSLRNQYEN